MPTTARPVARRPLAVAILVALATTSALPAFAQQPTAAPAQAPATDAEAGTAACWLPALKASGTGTPACGDGTTGCVMQPASTKAAARGPSRLRLRAEGVGTAPG